MTAITQHARRFVSRMLGVPPPTTGYHVERRVPVPMRDGVVLLADHYIPETATPAGTLLIRGPYGRDFPFSSLTAGVYAARGYHVVLQSVRGTFGSGGVFDPPVNEAADGADTVQWLRQQPWYTGTFGTVGQSYLGQTQFALLEDPPPDYAAAVIIVGVHNFAMSAWGTGAFAVNDFLGWSNTVAHQEDPRRLLTVLRQIRARTVIERTAAQLPLGAAGRALLGDAAPWWEKWLEHSDPGDDFWHNHTFTRGLDNAEVPVLLIGGWQDIFLEQTLEQYRHLHARDVEVALTIGPWTHTSMMARAAAPTLRESLHWLGTHLGGRPAATRRPVRVYVTGGRSAPGWRELPSWPPATAPRVFFTEPGRLLDAVPAGAATRSSFTFDPHDPTPTVGGRLLSPAGGYRRDEKLAERGDVVSFTSDPLTENIDVYGAPVLELTHESDNPHVDIAVRLSGVDRRGRSRNISDGYRRLVREPGAGPVRIELDEIAHRFAAGTRIRVLIAGGSHPRYARNLGTGEPQLTGRQMVPATHTVHHGGGTRLVLPVGAARPGAY